MELNYEERYVEIGIKAQIHFAWKKISKLYPLHIVCILGMLILAIPGVSSKEEVFTLIGKVLLNMALLQSWCLSTTVAMSLNGVAWYLSTCLFLYFMFPLVIKRIKQYKSIKTPLISSFSVFTLMVILRAIVSRFYGIDGTFPVWFSYCFPIYRLGDFFIGCNLGYIVKRCEVNKTVGRGFTIAEIVAFTLCFAVSIIQSYTFENPILTVTFTSAIINLPISALLIYLFYKNYGLLSKALTNRVLIWLGNLSPYLFLIHYTVIAWVKAICIKICDNPSKIVITVISLPVSLLAASAYHSIQRKVRKHENH